jgi:hypothetical protein
MRRAAVAVFAAGVLAYIAFAAIPWLTRDRDFPSTIPQPPPLTAQSVVALGPGDVVCMRAVAVEQHAGQVRFVTGTYGKPGPPLEVRVTGEGYRTTARLPGGYADNSAHAVAIEPPTRPLLVTACIRDAGARKVALYGSSDRSRSRVLVTVNGHGEGVAPQLAFYEREPVSIAERLSSVVERVAAFHGFLGHTWLVWLVALLVVAAVPAGIGAALWLAMGRE